MTAKAKAKKEKRDARVSGRVKSSTKAGIASFLAKNDKWSESDCIQEGLDLFLKKHARA